jgi:hypothetical protein
MRVDELRTALEERAWHLGGTEPLGPQARAAAVRERVRAGSARRRTTRVAGALVGVVVAVAGLVLGPSLVPDPGPGTFLPQQPMVQGPPRLAGFPLPARLTVRGLDYSYERGEQVDQSQDILRVAVAASNHRQVLGWATSFGSLGRVVVSVDGEVVARTPTGAFEYGARLAPGETHLVVVRVTQPVPGRQMGVAIYGPLTF